MVDMNVQQVIIVLRHRLSRLHAQLPITQTKLEMDSQISVSHVQKTSSASKLELQAANSVKDRLFRTLALPHVDAKD
jgi:hypothetical protein